MATTKQLELMITDLADILSDIEDRVKLLEKRAGQLDEGMSRARRLLLKISKDNECNSCRMEETCPAKGERCNNYESS